MAHFLQNRLAQTEVPMAKSQQQVEWSHIESLIEEIEDDHKDLKKFIEVLKDEDASFKERKEAYKSFAQLLKSHASSEEKAVYDICLKVEDLKQQAHEAYLEHTIAENLLKTIPSIREETKWCAYSKVLAELVEHHIEEEEGEFLPSLKKQIEAQKQEQMAEEFLTLRQKSQRDFSEENGGVLARMTH